MGTVWACKGSNGLIAISMLNPQAWFVEAPVKPYGCMDNGMALVRFRQKLVSEAHLVKLGVNARARGSEDMG